MSTVYLSGPITRDGQADTVEITQNIERFFAVESELALRNVEVLSPLNNGMELDATWQEHMRADLAMLMRADELVLLEGWEDSRGSTLELFIATQIGIPVTLWA